MSHALQATMAPSARRRGLSLWGWLRPREPEPVTSLEQRSRARLSVRAGATLVEVDAFGNPGRTWGVEVLNISREGAAIATPIFMAPGAAVMLHFPATKTGPARHIMANVVHIRRLNELDYMAGLKFETYTQRESQRRRRAGRN